MYFINYQIYKISVSLRVIRMLSRRPYLTLFYQKSVHLTKPSHGQVLGIYTENVQPN